jgi:hypothetical protein
MNVPKSEWAKGITKVLWVEPEEIDNSTACVGVKTGTLYLNKRVFPRLSRAAQYFIICHEWAHLEYATADEVETDRRAFEYYVKSGMSLKEAVKSLLFDGPQYPEITERQNALFKAALTFDKQQNG